MRTFRRPIALVLLFLLIGCIGACGSDPSSVETGLETVPVDSPVNTSDDPAASPFVGSFKNTYNAMFASLSVDVFELEDDIPVIECLRDGTFTLRVVDVAAERQSYSMTGTWTVDGDTAFFVPEGGEETYFQMTLISADEMRYSGEEYYCVTQGDIFTRI